MIKLMRGVWVSVALALGCHAAMAQQTPSAPVAFAVEPQPLLKALNAWAQQAGCQLIWPSGNRAAEQVSPRVQGQFTPQEALRRLLEGSGLGYEFIDGQTVAIVAKETAAARTNTASMTAVEASATKESMSAAQANGETRESAASSPQTTLDEIIVTAQKRSERLIEVPISIVALSAEELQRRRITSVDDLSLAVPGLAIQSSGSFQRRIMLRGVSNSFGNGSLIGLYLDEASVTSASPVIQLDLPSYDLQRIEVLRGPQGTLYGEGSAGGTIRFITQEPQLDRFAASANLSALSTEGEPGGRIDGVLNIPLIRDEWALRISGTANHQAGWMDQPAAGRENFNDQNLANVRVRTLWQPNQQFTANLMAVVHRNDAAPNVGEDERGNYAQVFNLTTTPDVDDKYQIYNLTLSYDFPGMQLLGTSTYTDQDKTLRNQGFRFPLLGTGFDAHFLLDHRWGAIATEEVRLVSTGSGPWNWTVGAFYQDAKYNRDLHQYFAAPTAPGAPLPALQSVLTRLAYDSWAAFGDVSYGVTDRLTLGAGLRYYETDQQFASNGLGFPAATFDSVNPRIYARYMLAENLSFYGSAAKGFRTGGFNNLATQPAYDPEEVWTYELGAKALLGEARVSVEATIFHTEYQEYQIAGFIPGNTAAGNVTSNAGDATIDGIELAVSWQPAEQWTLSLNGNYVDTEFVTINALTSSHAVGDPLDLFPKYGYTASVQRDFALNGAPSFLRVDYNEQGKMTYRNRRNGLAYFNESDAINMLNVHLGMQWRNDISLGLFVQNAFDDRGFTDPFSIEENAARAKPRTFGIEFGFSF